LLKIFEIEKNDIKPSEYLDISRSGDDNTILLAVSVIMQGLRNEAELSELIADISSDMKEDGILSNVVLGQKLINDIRLINLTEVRTKIESRYSELGVELAVPDFEKYVRQFINNTEFQANNTIEYITNGTTGPNVLTTSRLNYPSRTYSDSICAITAKLPRGTSLKVIIYPDYIPEVTYPGDTSVTLIPGHYCEYSLAFKENSGWAYNTDSYPNNRSMTFTNTANDRTIDAEIFFVRHGGAKFEIYENNQTTPTWIKKINW